MDVDWAELPNSKPKFAVHPGYNSDDPKAMGDFDHSGFIALPDGGSFDVLSFWVQCDRPCELHLYELGFGLEERELLTNDSIEAESLNGRIILSGGLGNKGMKLVELQKIYGDGAGTKIRWMRYWARDTNEDPKAWLSPARELAVAMDDLILRRRIDGAACMEPKQ